MGTHDAPLNQVAPSVGLWAGGSRPYAIGSKKLGMWLFIISDALTFSALLVAYSYLRIASEQWPGPIQLPETAGSSVS